MAVAFALVYEVQDESGDRSTTTVHLPTAFTIAQFREFGRALAGFVDDLSLGLIVGAGITVEIDISALTGNVVGLGADIYEVGAFQFVTAEGRPVEINIPGILPGVVTSGDEIDQGDADVAAFIAAIENGLAVTGGTASPSDVDEGDITDVVYSRFETRSSQKRS